MSYDVFTYLCIANSNTYALMPKLLSLWFHLWSALVLHGIGLIESQCQAKYLSTHKLLNLKLKTFQNRRLCLKCCNTFHMILHKQLLSTLNKFEEKLGKIPNCSCSQTDSTLLRPANSKMRLRFNRKVLWKNILNSFKNSAATWVKSIIPDGFSPKIFWFFRLLVK